MLESHSALLGEDLPGIGRMCATLLEIGGAKVRVVETVGEALAALRPSRPDVIVADVRLSGGQCAAPRGAIRDVHHGPSVPTMTGDTDARSGDRPGGDVCSMD